MTEFPCPDSREDLVWRFRKEVLDFLPEDQTVSIKPGFVLGPVTYAGGSAPRPSSAACLSLSEGTSETSADDLWIPWPCLWHPDDPGQAARFVWSGRSMVMPIVRLIDQEAGEIRYLDWIQWSREALTKWKFVCYPQDSDEPGTTGPHAKTLVCATSQATSVPGPLGQLRAAAVVLHYALFGSATAKWLQVPRMRLPRSPMRMRPVTGTPLGRAGASSLVVTLAWRPRPSVDLRLMSPVEDSGAIPTKGKNLIVVAAVDQVLHYRIFDGDGKRVVNTDEKKLTERSRQIENFRKHLESLWPPHELTENEKQRIVSAVASIVGQPQPKPRLPSHTQALDARICPDRPPDLGIDPVHTPDHAEVRLIGRLGRDVRVQDKKLVQAGTEVSLSISTAQIPFAGHDDPRRLLLGAGMQTQAIPVVGSEAPLVRTEADSENSRPPGVNLRVGYLAWRGLNHEDAWVLSESAARRLAAIERLDLWCLVYSLELPTDVLVERGQFVRRGEPLLRRKVDSGLLDIPIAISIERARIEEQITLDPLPREKMPWDGKVVDIKTWNLVTGDGIPAQWHRPSDLIATYRQVVRITVQRKRPLEVGDKLANRHGHKGIVGAILADEAMPRWQEKPLEALVDPIGVINRSNWGQLHEGLAGAILRETQDEDKEPLLRDLLRASTKSLLERAERLGADRAGRFPIEPPETQSDRWLDGSVRAMAGIQFLMRLPQHASDTLAAAPQRGGLGKKREQRFGEMDRWALWGHGQFSGRGNLTESFRRVLRLLRASGIESRASDDALVFQLLDLEGEPPPSWTRFRAPAPRDHRQVQDILDWNDLSPDLGAAFPLPEAVQVKITREESERIVAWVPLLPQNDRPRDPRHGMPHPLTSLLRKIIRLSWSWSSGSLSSGGSDLQAKLRAKLRFLVQQWFWRSRAEAIGTTNATMKRSRLRGEVLGSRRHHSARAVISPAGPLTLGLDEVGVPLVVARALTGLTRASTSREEVRSALNCTRVWLKRDPVLHPYGLLHVQARLLGEEFGKTIRLAASLLGPLGADFDGDAVVVFGELAGAEDIGRPQAMARHPLLMEPRFQPGKQYRYGLTLMAGDPDRREHWNQQLQRLEAPCLQGSVDAWFQAVAAVPNPDPVWWRLVEQAALDALSKNPGMDLGLLPIEELSRLDVVQVRAAKADSFSQEGRPLLDRLLEGRGLEIYESQKKGDRIPDPIATVMVPGRMSVGRFGAVPRKLVHALRLPAGDAESRRPFRRPSGWRPPSQSRPHRKRSASKQDRNRWPTDA